MVVVEILPQVTNAQGGWREHINILDTQHPSYSYEGTASLTGKINLTGMEPLTNEKIWSKSVLIPTQNMVLKTSKSYYQRSEQVIFQDPGTNQAIGEALENVYKGIMDKLAAHFEPAEFRSLKPQIKELKSKKGF